MPDGSLLEWFYDALPPCVGGVNVGMSSTSHPLEEQHPQCLVCATRRRLLQALPFVYRSYKRLSCGAENNGAGKAKATATPVAKAETGPRREPVLLLFQVCCNKWAYEEMTPPSSLASTCMDDVCSEMLEGFSRTDKEVAFATEWWVLLEDAVAALGVEAVLGIKSAENAVVSLPLLLNPGVAANTTEDGVVCLFPLKRWEVAVEYSCGNPSRTHLLSCPVVCRTSAANTTASLLSPPTTTTATGVSSRVSDDTLRGAWLACVELLCATRIRVPSLRVVPWWKEDEEEEAATAGGVSLVGMAVRGRLGVAVRRYIHTISGAVATAAAADFKPPLHHDAVKAVIERLTRHHRSCADCCALVGEGWPCHLRVSAELVSAASEIHMGGPPDTTMPSAADTFACLVRAVAEEWLHRHGDDDEVTRMEWITRLFRRVAYELYVQRPIAGFATRIAAQEYLSAALLSHTAGDADADDDRKDCNVLTAGICSSLLDDAIRRRRRMFSCCWFERGDGCVASKTAELMGDELLLHALLLEQRDSCREFFFHNCITQRCERLRSIETTTAALPALLAEGHYYHLVLRATSAAWGTGENFTMGGASSLAELKCRSLSFFEEWLAALRKLVSECRGPDL